MASISDVPAGVTLAGESFNYVNPPTFATIALVNAPLDPDHVNIGLNRAAYDTFIDGEIAAGRAYTAVNINLQNPAHDLILPIPFETSPYFYNYGRLNIGGVNWYIFYNAEYMNKTSTRFIADIDEAASYAWSLGYSPIERGHVAVAASQNDYYGDQYMTAAEPIDAPPTRAITAESILPGSDTPSSWRVIVVSANDLRGAGAFPYFTQHVNQSQIANAASNASQATNGIGSVGLQINVPESPYPWRVGTGTTMQIWVPYVTASPVSTIDGVAVGGGVYVFSLTGYAAFMSIMQGAPWVVDGISEINIVPDWSVGGIGGGGSHAGAAKPPTDPTSGLWAAAAGMPTFVLELVTATTPATALAGWRGTVGAALGLGVYRKALTSQFSRIMVSDGETEREFLPEVWKTSGVGFTLVSEATHGTPDTRAIPIGYTALGDQQGIVMSRGGTAARAVSGWGVANSNTGQQDNGPMMAAYSSSTTRQVLLDQKALAIVLAATSARLNVGIQGIQTILGTATAAVGGGGAGAGLNALGGIGALATSAIQANANLDILDISKDGSFNIATYQLGLTGVQNFYAFSAWAQSQYAVSGHGGAHDLAGAWRTILGRGLTALITSPTADAVNRALSMWKRYGYMVGRSFAPSRLDSMSQMTYWKTNGAVIVGALPHRQRQTIAAAFDRGLTVWASIGAIGTDVTGTNAPTAGISY